MAEAVVSIPSRDLLECAVCLDSVSDHRLLPCGHSFCLNCLKPLVVHQSLKCPLCGKVCPLPDEGLQNLPRSPVLMSILDHLCEICRSQNRAFHCKDCGKHMCLVCKADCKHEEEIETKDLVSTAYDTLHQIHQDIDNIHTQMSTISEEIDQTTQTMMESIQTRHRQLKKELTREGNKQIEKLNGQYRELAEKIVKMKALNGPLQNVLGEDTVDPATTEEWRKEIVKISQNRYKVKIEYTNNNETQNEVYGRIQSTVISDESSISSHQVVSSGIAHTPVNYFCKGDGKAVLGCKGSRRGQFSFPKRVAVSPVTGNFVVCDSSNNRIQIHCDVWQVDSSGEKNGKFSFKQNGTVTVTSQGVIVVADTNNHRLQTFTEQGKFIKVIGQKGSEPGQFMSPKGLSCDKLGRIYVCDNGNHRIQVVEPDGTVVMVFGSDTGVHWCPSAIAICPNGDVVVVDDKGAIQLFERNGKFKYPLRYDNDQKPTDVAVDRDGNIVVTDGEANKVYVMGPQGRFIKSWGSPGEKLGQLNGPSGVACTADGRVVVVEQRNHRLQIF